MKKIRYCLILMLGLGVMGCSPFCSSYVVEIKPDTLPVAKINKPYYVLIVIDTSVAYLDISESFLSDLTVKEIYPYPTFKDSKGRVEISGTPSTLGEYTLRIEGAAHGTMCIGQRFKKEYKLRVTAR